MPEETLPDKTKKSLPPKKKTKVEKMGKEAMTKVLELFRDGNSFSGIAKTMNEEFKPEVELTYKNVRTFLLSESNEYASYLKERRKLSIMKFELIADKDGMAAKDLKRMEDAQVRLEESKSKDLSQEVQRSKAISDIAEQKQDLLRKHRVLDGSAFRNKDAPKISVLQIIGDSSEVMKKISENINVEVPEKVIDVEVVNEVSKGNSDELDKTDKQTEKS